MNAVSTIFVLAILVEALIEYGKEIVVNKKVQWQHVSAIVLGVGFALLAQVDLFAAIEVNFVVPYVGQVLTGIIFSRGANYVSDFLQKARTVKE